MENQNPVQAQNQPLTPIQPQPIIEPTPPVQPEPPQPEIIEVPSNSSGFPFKRILILLIVLIIIVISGGAYFLNKNLNKISTIPSPTPTATINLTLAPTPTSNAADATANWKTYNETAYKFLIKYPEGWIVTPYDYKKYPVASPDQPQLVVSFANKTFTGIAVGTPGLLSIGISYIKPSISFADFITREKNTANNSVPKPISIIDNLVNFGNAKTHQVLYKYNDRTTTTVYIPNDNGSVYMIGTNLINEDVSLNSQFSNMLSTFKFTDQASPTPTCKPRPTCLDATPRCMIPETSDMCPKGNTITTTPVPTPINSSLSTEGQSCGLNAGAGGNAQCATGLKCTNIDPVTKIGTCVKQ